LPPYKQGPYPDCGEAPAAQAKWHMGTLATNGPSSGGAEGDNNTPSICLHETWPSTPPPGVVRATL